MRVVRRLGILAIASGLAAGSLVAVTSAAGAASDWPDAAAWVPVLVTGAPVADVSGDSIDPSLDAVGDAEHPAAYVSSEGANPGGVMAFRLRLDGDPRQQNTIGAGQWVVQLSTNEDPNAYDMAVMVSGGGAQRLVVFDNTDRQCCTSDLPENEVGEEHLDMGTVVRVLEADSAFSGTPDYFLEWQVPGDFADTPLTGSTGPVRFLFGTSQRQDGTLGSLGDIAGPDGPQTAWQYIGSDLYARSPATGNLVRETTPPTVNFPALPTFVLANAAPTWSGADPGTGIAGFDLGARTARWNQELGQESAVLTRSSLSGIDDTLPRGSTTCYRVRSINGANLSSAWTHQRCTARPLDQNAAGASTGWRTVQGSAYWGGSAKVSSRRGASLTLTGVHARRLAIVSTTCPTCGEIVVVLDGVSRGVIDLRSRTTKKRQIIELPAFGEATGKLVLKVVSANKPVEIDGIGISAA